MQMSLIRVSLRLDNLTFDFVSIAQLIMLVLLLRSEVEFSIDDFNTIGGKVPLIANLKPHGKVRTLILTPLCTALLSQMCPSMP